MKTYKVFILIFCLLILFFIVGYEVSYKNYDNYENFEDYGEVVENRDDQCYVYLDTFSNTFLSTKKNINTRFLNWCKNYRRLTGVDPIYRTAELAYRGLVNN